MKIEAFLCCYGVMGVGKELSQILSLVFDWLSVIAVNLVQIHKGQMQRCFQMPCVA